MEMDRACPQEQHQTQRSPWYGHQQERNRARPKETWRRSLQKEMKGCGWPMGWIQQKAADRQRWRSSVKALCAAFQHDEEISIEDEVTIQAWLFSFVDRRPNPPLKVMIPKYTTCIHSWQEEFPLGLSEVALVVQSLFYKLLHSRRYRFIVAFLHRLLQLVPDFGLTRVLKQKKCLIYSKQKLWKAGHHFAIWVNVDFELYNSYFLILTGIPMAIATKLFVKFESD